FEGLRADAIREYGFVQAKKHGCDVLNGKQIPAYFQKTTVASDITRSTTFRFYANSAFDQC
ncbi:TPA: hypothetical protein ACHFYE_005375, partial [Klebsiella pneumoniae]